jgi:hypothetical protein
MNVITNLSGTAAQAPWDEPRGIVSSVYNEPARGFIRQINLGAAGLQIKGGGKVIGIPLAEILRLAESIEPAMAPPVPATQP